MKCIYCDNESTMFCDFLIALEPKHRQNNKLYAGIESEHFTCDAPVCNDHAVAVGHIHCEGFADSVDYCLYCYEKHLNGVMYQILFKDEADAERRKIHVEIRRSLIKVA